MSTTKKTPFYEKHIKARAKLVEFAGYTMPILYEGIVPEHQKVRKAVGMFDISHMGEFRVKGTDAKSFINRMVTNDVGTLSPHKVLYTAMCYEDGGIVDDLLVYNLGGEDWLLVVNGANVEKDWQWLIDHKPESVTMIDETEETPLLAVQGPYSEQVLQKLAKFNLSTLPYYTSASIEMAGKKVLISRTGYTGEDGFEIYHTIEHALNLWDAILEAGQPVGLAPIGLGARDSLRLEMKYCLYGNDIDKTTNPIEAGLSWVVKLEKGDFIGRDAIIDAKANLERRLVCIETEERAFPRHGYPILIGGQEMGHVTSGTFSPSISKGIALGYVNRPHTKSGTEVGIKIRDRVIGGRIVKPPFYTKGTVKAGK